MLLSKVARPTVIIMTEKIGSPTMGRRIRISVRTPKSAENNKVMRKAGIKGI
jgi:hypothetical protein